MLKIILMLLLNFICVVGYKYLVFYLINKIHNKNTRLILKRINMLLMIIVSSLVVGFVDNLIIKNIANIINCTFIIFLCEWSEYK